jgi:hypothetical protein
MHILHPLPKARKVLEVNAVEDIFIGRESHGSVGRPGLGFEATSDSGPRWEGLA